MQCNPYFQKESQKESYSHLIFYNFPLPPPSVDPNFTNLRKFFTKLRQIFGKNRGTFEKSWKLIKLNWGKGAIFTFITQNNLAEHAVINSIKTYGFSRSRKFLRFAHARNFFRFSQIHLTKSSFTQTPCVKIDERGQVRRTLSNDLIPCCNNSSLRAFDQIHYLSHYQKGVYIFVSG